MDMLKVSIIIPVYKVENYIEECLESAVKVDLTDKEIIIVDDGSTDNSIAIANVFASKFPEKIKIVKKPNGGLSSARNFGIQFAQGKYFIFFDSDDIINAEVIDDMVKNAEEYNSDIVVADYYEFSSDITNGIPRYDKAQINQALTDESERLDKLFTINVSFAVWNKLYRKEFLKENRLSFLEGFWFEDLDFVFRAFYKAKKITKVNKLFYGYRQREGSIMKSASLKILDKMDVMDQLRDFLLKESKFHLYKNGYDILYIKMLLSIFFVCFKSRDKKIAIEIVNKCLSAPYLIKLMHSSLERKAELKPKERLVFDLIRYKILNKTTIALGIRFFRSVV